MSKDIYDKLKIIPELVKTYWMILIMVGSVSTGGWQWWDKQDAVTEAVQKGNKDVHEVTVAFQREMIKVEPKKAECNQCATFINEHKRKEH